MRPFLSNLINKGKYQCMRTYHNFIKKSVYLRWPVKPFYLSLYHPKVHQSEYWACSQLFYFHISKFSRYILVFFYVDWAYFETITHIFSLISAIPYFSLFLLSFWPLFICLLLYPVSKLLASSTQVIKS